MNGRFIKELLAELPKLEAGHVIDGEAASALRGHYAAQLRPDTRARTALVISLGVIAAALIGGGTIMIFAHNWDMFTPFMRLSCAFAPLAVAIVFGLWVLLHDKGAAWREPAALFLSLTAAAALAIVSQVYHTSGTMTQFLTAWLALSLLVIYIFNSTALALVYSIGCFYFIVDWRSEFWPPLLLAAGLAPYLTGVLFVNKFTGVRSQICRVLLMVLAMAAFIKAANDCDFSLQLTLVVLFTSFYVAALANRRYSKYNLFLLAQPALVVWLILATYSDFWDNGYSESSPKTAGMFALTALILTATFLYVLLRRRSFHAILPLFLPPLAVLPYFLGNVDVFLAFMCAIFYIVYSVGVLFSGLRMRSMALVNIGMAMLSILIFVRFVALDGISALAMGLSFIILGAAMLIANWRIAVYFRNHAVDTGTETES